MNLLNSGPKSVHEHFAGGSAEWMDGVQGRDGVVALAGQRVRQVAFMNNPVQPETTPPAEAAHYTAPVPAEQTHSDLDFPATQLAAVPDNRPATAAQFESAEAALLNVDNSAQAMIAEALQAAEAARQEQEKDA